MDIIAILQKAQDPTYTPPITLQQLGIILFEANRALCDWWPDTMRLGWLWAWRSSSDADTSAYLVATGGAR